MDVKRLKNAVRSIDVALEQPIITVPVPGGGVRLPEGALLTAYALVEARTAIQEVLDSQPSFDDILHGRRIM